MPHIVEGPAHLTGPVPGGVTGFPPLILPADRLKRLCCAVEVSVVALEQSGIKPLTAATKEDVAAFTVTGSRDAARVTIGQTQVHPM